jgi:predicted MFS family arabinose efflux permease
MLMGLYSLVLGLGYLVGNALGGVAAQEAYFDGLAYLTMILATVGMLSLGVLLLAQRRRS